MERRTNVKHLKEICAAGSVLTRSVKVQRKEWPTSLSVKQYYTLLTSEILTEDNDNG